MVDRTAAKLTEDYAAMGDSVSLINAVIAGDSMAGDSAVDRQSTVDRNVEHLELMKSKHVTLQADLTSKQTIVTNWDSANMTATTNAITAGKGYTAS